ncbi:MAG: four helix bundle protein [Dehalococcoidia bacterium]|nr:four helix bundle protein [Dehalococcoidia bacterium]
MDFVRGRAERFEDLVAWQRARALTRRVYEVTRTGTFRADRALGQQAQRAAVSVMANIAEGFERGRPAEFHQFLSVAKASCGELRSHLYVALDAGYLDRPLWQVLHSETEEVGRIIGGLRASIERRHGGGWSSGPTGRSASALSTQHSKPRSAPGSE